MVRITLNARNITTGSSHLVAPNAGVASKLSGEQASVYLFPLAALRQNPQPVGDTSRRPELDAMSGIGQPAGRPVGCRGVVIRGFGHRYWPTTVGKRSAAQ